MDILTKKKGLVGSILTVLTTVVVVLCLTVGGCTAPKSHYAWPGNMATPLTRLRTPN